MGKVNVYLPDDLERAVRETGIPVSSVCQAALRHAVDAMATIRGTGDLGAPARAHLTARLADILRTRPDTALDLLGAILLHGENLGARVLQDLGVDLPAPKPRPKKGKGATTTEVREVLVAAYRVALELHHNYLGAEHVVIALAHEDAPTAHLFAALGLDDRAVRARVVHLIANPWRVDRAAPRSEATPEVLDRFEAELVRMASELDELRSSAKLRRWPPTTSS